MPKIIWLLICSLTLLNYGCAYSYVDRDGTQHIIGLVSMQIKPTDDNDTLAGNIVDLTSVGVAYHSIPDNTSFTIGYSRNIFAALKNHALVAGYPLSAPTGNCLIQNHQDSEGKL